MATSRSKSSSVSTPAQRERGGADRLERPDLPAADPVEVEVDRREAVDEGAVEVEEGGDLRAFGAGVHLGQALRQQHR